MTLAPYVATLGRGPGRSRGLTQDEARAAMALMLSGEAAPEAVGALLMLLRMKGETAEEIAGFAQAAQAATVPVPAAALDWPSYAAGRTRGRPWFLLAARLVAQAGHSVLIHGRNGSDLALRAHLAEASVPCADTVAEVTLAMDRGRIAYVPLEALSPALDRLLSLRDVLGLRSCINTVCRMLNPSRAQASVQGVFHPSYRMVQADAALLMRWQTMTVIKGGGGEFERQPAKPVEAFGLRGGAIRPKLHAPVADVAVRLAEGPHPATTLAELWCGRATDLFAEQVVVGTAALALDTLGAETPVTLARRLWADRAAGLEDAA